MLKLKNIKKTYTVGEYITPALDDVSLSFRKNEFVAILGASGSGKTTCLNIIGGLDRYDSGDLIINSKSTKKFKDKDWDAYRNNTIGFVFQSYNLISHLSIVANVEMGMTLSGVSRNEKHRKALEVLERVGLKDHLHKKPTQLSGGQMQRVAIARALANDPDILLCDEPTGALDTSTSVQIMDLIKEVAADKLVIMVTHNPELARKYADRIVEFSDGKIISDSNPYIDETDKGEFQLNKTSMSFPAALRLSFNNIRTKLGRTFLTAFASSIGIIGIALILSLSVGFQLQIDDFQAEAMTEFPIMITQQTAEIDIEQMQARQKEIMDQMNGGDVDYLNTDQIYLYNRSERNALHTNVFTDEYIDYLEKIDPNICKSIGYTRTVAINLLLINNDKVNVVKTNEVKFGSYPTTLAGSSYLENNYDLLAGEYPQDENGLVLVVDSKNRMEDTIASTLGFDIKDLESIDFEDIIGIELRAVMNNDFYMPTEYGGFTLNMDYGSLYDAEDNLELKIVGILRPKENVKFPVITEGIAYNDALTKRIIESSQESDIVKSQIEADYNVLTMESIDEGNREQLISYLGGNGVPYMITVYPINFETKDDILSYLDDYNEAKEDEDKIIYMDLADTITNMTSGIMDGITIVLIAFSATSLVVSMIMISIITYTSVLERTKEIGILKALGARKKDISRVFDAETFILGVFSGTLGIVIAWLMTIPINALILNITGLENVARLKLDHGIILILISTVLTMLGGHIPAKMAAKKDAVEALRAE